jgi:transglutaminase-like putative cysteine protease
LTYERYTGQGWSSQSNSLESYPAGELISDRLVSYPQAIYKHIQQTIQEVASEAPGGVLYAAGELEGASQAYQVAWRAPGDMFGAQIEQSAYTASSRLVRPASQQLRLAGEDYPDWVLKTYLNLPRSVPQRVWDLALDLTASEPTPYDQAAAIERYLRTIPYTLEVGSPPSNRDLVDYFLFDLQRGFCDYYASAMVVLARAAGLPARLVVGYASGVYLPEQASYQVSQADAHAWAEIYFPGYGWVEFEPTAGRPAIERPEEADQLAAQSGAPAGDNAIRNQLFQPARQWLRIGLIVLAGALLLLAAWWLVDWLWLGGLPAQRAIGLVYRRFYRQGKVLLGPGLPGQTAAEFVARLSEHLGKRWPTLFERPAGQQAQAAMQRLAERYGRVIYSPHPASQTDKNGALEDWKILRWKLWWARLKKSG